MQTSLKRCGLKFSSRKDMSAKFPRGGGGAGPFLARSLLKVASPILWGSIYIFDLKMITFMLEVAIGDYCLILWTLLLQLI